MNTDDWRQTVVMLTTWKNPATYKKNSNLKQTRIQQNLT